jgi:hypothetical protein
MSISERAKNNANKRKFSEYLAAYIAEEISRGNEWEADTIEQAIEAFEGGACDDGNDYILTITSVAR